MDAKCLLLLLLLLLFCNSCCHSHRPDVSDLATWTSFDWHNCDGFLRVAIGRDPRLGSQLSRKKMPSIKSSIQVVVFSFHFPFCFLVFFGLFCFCFFFLLPSFWLPSFFSLSSTAKGNDSSNGQGNWVRVPIVFCFLFFFLNRLPLLRAEPPSPTTGRDYRVFIYRVSFFFFFFWPPHGRSQ